MQGIGVHLIPAWVSPQLLHVLLNEALSSDQHNPREEMEKPIRSGIARVNNKQKAGDL